MNDPGRTSAVVVTMGVVLLLVGAPLLFLGGSGAGLAAPAPSPSPLPSPVQSPVPVPPASPAPASPAPTATPPSAPAGAPSPGTPTVVVVDVTLSQEVPVPQAQTPRTAAGTGAVVINAARTEVGFAFTFTGLSGALAAAHFHRAARGEAGPVVQTICGAPAPALSGACPAAASGTVAGVWPIPAAMVADLQAGRLYVNFHTALNPGGEIRGQIILLR
ncbi:MAG: CHRD domain-containing protein [bacterium]